MKCPFCGVKAKKVHKNMFNCKQCGEFSEEDIEKESGQKSKEKKKHRNNK